MLYLGGVAAHLVAWYLVMLARPRPRRYLVDKRNTSASAAQHNPGQSSARASGAPHFGIRPQVRSQGTRYSEVPPIHQTARVAVEKLLDRVFVNVEQELEGALTMVMVDAGDQQDLARQILVDEGGVEFDPPDE